MMAKLSLEYLAIITLENSKSYFVHAEYINFFVGGPKEWGNFNNN